jgi:hypothetical protein
VTGNNLITVMMVVVFMMSRYRRKSMITELQKKKACELTSQHHSNNKLVLRDKGQQAKSQQPQPEPSIHHSPIPHRNDIQADLQSLF